VNVEEAHPTEIGTNRHSRKKKGDFGIKPQAAKLFDANVESSDSTDQRIRFRVTPETTAFIFHNAFANMASISQSEGI
jgi:hypothetical protein